MGTIALTYDLSSCYPFLINFSKLLLDPEVSFNRKLNRGLQAVYNGREADVRNIPVFLKSLLVTHLDFCGIICYSISYLLGRLRVLISCNRIFRK